MDGNNQIEEVNDKVPEDTELPESEISEVRYEDNPEDIERIEGAVEAILFSVGDAVSVKSMADVLLVEPAALEKIIMNMMDDYKKEKRGIQIVRLEDSYQMCTKSEHFDVLSKMVNMPRKHNLTDTLMETLSIIAYKQPITRQEIEAIRGVSCVHAVNKLVEYKLVEEVGRLDAVGRPILFGTTEDFLRSFGVTSMDELPAITPDKIEDFRQEAIEEVNIKVEI